MRRPSARLLLAVLALHAHRRRRGTNTANHSQTRPNQPHHKHTNPHPTAAGLRSASLNGPSGPPEAGWTGACHHGAAAAAATVRPSCVRRCRPPTNPVPAVPEPAAADHGHPTGHHAHQTIRQCPLAGPGAGVAACRRRESNPEPVCRWPARQAQRLRHLRRQRPHCTIP